MAAVQVANCPAEHRFTQVYVAPLSYMSSSSPFALLSPMVTSTIESVEEVKYIAPPLWGKWV